MGSKHEPKKARAASRKFPHNERSGGLASGRKSKYRSKSECPIKGASDACHERAEKAWALANITCLKDKMVLARDFYWCSEQSFFDMRVTLGEAAAFANANFDATKEEDSLPDVFRFFPRVWQAQRAAKRYVMWLVIEIDQRRAAKPKK